MEENINYTQMDGCSIEKLCPILSDVFEQDITSETMIKDIVEDDTRNIDKLQRCIIVNFGVHPIVGDIISSENVLKLSTVIQNYIDSPKYLMSPEEIRRLQLEEIANNNSLDIITGKLTEASGILNDSLDKIKAVSAPTDEIGHKTKVGWINDVLDFVDPKVSQKELINVVSKIDENSKNAFDNLGTAIAATNTWIDAICKALIWIIKIEDDLYDVSEESSSKLTDMSRLLSTDGKNIEGLTKFGEIEKSRRKRLQQKMREFTADIEGKFDFLNDLNKDLRKKFDDSFGLVEDKFDNAEKLLNEKVDLCINKLSQSQNDFISQSKEDTSQALKALAKKREDDTMEMHKEQKESLEKIDKLVNESLAKTEEKSDALVKSQEEFISQSKEQSNDFMANQNTLLKEMKKQLKIYKTISIIALAVSIVSILYGIIL
jgi:hypothetical protein